MIPTPADLINSFPIDANEYSFIEQSRQTIKNILDGIDRRKILIIGPCSIHDVASTIEYAKKFNELAQIVSEHFFLIMRCYLEKPRTSIGWKGFIYDPYLDHTYNIKAGLQLSRQLLVELTKMKIPVGCEFLDLTVAPYIDDLISWGCIGARTTTSQPHRQFVSHLNFPVGFKNTTDGNIDNPINAIIAANACHHYLGLNLNGHITQYVSKGNSDCHIVLRGHETGPNYDENTIDRVLMKIDKAGIRRQIIIDCSHDNCKKMYLRQINVFHSVMQQIFSGNSAIVGAMLESHLMAGSQSLADELDLKFGMSVTDPCLDFEATRQLILEAFNQSVLISMTSAHT